MAHPAELAREIALPADWRSASRFRWVCVGLTALLVSVWIWTVGIYTGGAPTYDISVGDRSLVWLLPFYAVLFSYASLVVIPVALVAGLGSATWFVRASFWALTGALGGRASTVALYLTAWILPTWMLLIFDYYVMPIADLFHWNLRPFEIYLLLVSVPHVFLLVAGPVACFRVLYRATFSSFTRTVIASVLIPSGALVIFVLSTMAAIYGMGLLLIMVQSLVP
jgi:hypothetical protein